MVSTTSNSGPCPYLGRCDDPENYFAFATDGNCCYSGPRPVPVEPPYQVDNCLGEHWSECPLYRKPPAHESSPGVAILARVQQAFQQSPIAWEFVVIAVVVLGILVGVWLLALRPKDGSQAGESTPTEALTAAQVATNEFETAVAQVTAQTPTPTPSPTITSSPTPTPSPSPTATTMPTWTPSPSPTAAPSSTPSLTPSPTPSRTPTPTTAPPRPRATATSTPLPAPELLSPADGYVFPPDAEIVLTWQSIGVLPANVYYAVTVSFSHLGDTWYDDIPWLRDTRWTFSEHDYLLDLSDDGRFLWSVQVMLRTGLDAEGNPIGRAISPSSETRSMIWQQPGGAPPTPPPPPP